MEKGLVLQERDIELLEFLAEYKTITLDNTRYIYGTKTYQEKRICHLVKENYLTRLQHREIALSRKGKEFLTGLGVQIKEHCRNTNNIERLKVISDIAAFTKFSRTMNFIPSWSLKDRKSPTQDSRRYLGLLSFDQTLYTIYSLYGEKTDKYVTSLYYDLKKEREIYSSIIFTNDIDRIVYHKKKFLFCDSHLYLIKYNEFNKRIIRNYDKIRTCLFNDLSKRHDIKYTNDWNMDFLVDGYKYVKLALFLDLNQLVGLRYTIQANSSRSETMFVACFEEDEKYVTHLVDNCGIITLQKSQIEEYLDKNFIEMDGIKYDWPSE